MSLLNNIFGAGAQQALMGGAGQNVQFNERMRLDASNNVTMSPSLEQDRYNQLANQYSQSLAQSMMGAKQGVMQGIMASQQAIKPFNPNELGAFKMPLSQLVTLWQAKYGDEWVEVFEDDFWSDAMSRLKLRISWRRPGTGSVSRRTHEVQYKKPLRNGLVRSTDAAI